MKHKIVNYMLWIIILSSFVYVPSRIPSGFSVNALKTAIVYIDPNYIQIPENETGYQFTANVSIYRAVNLYAYDFIMYYNSTILNGTKIKEGTFLNTIGATFFNIVDFNDNYNNTHGRIWISCTLLGPQTGVNGSGTLVTITFKTNLSSGLSTLDLAKITLSDSSANIISHYPIDGTVYLGTPPQIKVPSDYPTIQQAINAATIGTTILVSNGTYFEQLTVNKTISLVGENKSTTIINANNTNIALSITANNIFIKGFTIQNATSYGLYFNYSSFNEISGNVIKNNGYGICLNNSIKNTVTNNLILENIHDGIKLIGTATITNNIVKSNGKHGIYLYFACANITENKIESNKYGITLNYSGGNIIRKNNLLNNTQNFSVDGEQLSDYIQNIDDSNKINTKKVYYLLNQKDCTINSDNFTNIGYLGIVNSTNIHIANFNITNNGEGILLAFTRNSTLENISLERNAIGIKCVNSQNNSITQTMLNKNYKGIELKNCQNNKITGNTIVNHHYAFYLYRSSENIIYHNNIINNTEQVYTTNPFSNIWDNGHHGNFWSSYNGTDKDFDGIGDTPYNIDVNQTDHYPLIHPYIPDIAITNLTVNSTKIYIGQTVALTVSIMNKWYETETFNVTIYANQTLIKTCIVSNLTSYTIVTLNFHWNTSDLTPSNYTVYAQAEILLGETEINDNLYIDGIIEVRMFNVDFNDDGIINILDLRKAAAFFNHTGDCTYDINFDKIVNLDDLEIIVAEFG
jgi:parallel beta-helix repeat protein